MTIHNHSETAGSPLRWAILAACCLAITCFQFIAMSYAPLFGEIANDLDVSLPDAIQLMTYFMLFSSISFFIGGLFVDRFGPAAAIIVSVVLAAFPTLATLWIGHSYAAVVVIRILQGCTVGFCMGGVVPMVLQWFPPHQRALALGITGAFNPLGAVLGVTLTPLAFTILGDWKAAMGLVSIIPFAVLAYCLYIFAATRGRAPALAPDGPQGAQAASGVVLKAALVSLYTWLGILVTFAANWLMQTAFSLTPSYFAEPVPVGLGFGPLLGGSLTGILQIASVASPVIAGYLASRYFNGRPGTLIVAGLVLVITYGALQFEAVYSTSALLFIFLVLPGLGLGTLMPLLMTKVGESYDPRIIGRMNGLWLGIGSFGGTVGLFVSARALDITGTYFTTINIIALVALVGAVLAILLNRLQGGTASAKTSDPDAAQAGS